VPDEKPILSLVTGTLNRPLHFKRLLRSITERTYASWELVVSDASDVEDGHYPYTANLPENIIVLPERPRLGCVKGYNRAFARARGKWVIWLNDDAEVMPGYDKAAITFMESYGDEIGLGALYYAENVLPYSINWYQGLPYANFGIISKELGDRIGWMDPDLHMYGNDNSVAFKVLLSGKGIGSIPDARIWHHVILDQWKVENQKHRSPDSRTLLSKYQPLLPQMKAVYEKYKKFVGPSILEE
jgi:GT2 family glycosyltransferase